MKKLLLLALALSAGSAAHAELGNCRLDSFSTGILGTANFGSVDPLAVLSEAPRASMTLTARCTRTAVEDPRIVRMALEPDAYQKADDLGVNAKYGATEVTLTWEESQLGEVQVQVPVALQLTGLATTTAPGTRVLEQRVRVRKQTCSSTTCEAVAAEDLLRAQATVNVVKSCRVSPATLSFGAIAASTQRGMDAMTSVSVACTKTTPYALRFSSAKRPNAGAGLLQMEHVNGKDLLAYQVYQDASRGTPLLKGSISKVGAGVSQAQYVFGHVPQNQFPTPGDYQDELTLTVEY